MKSIRWIAMLGICCLSFSSFGATDLSESLEADDTNAIVAEPTASAVTNADAALPKPPDANAPIANDGSTALHEAAQFDRLDDVKLLLEKGAAINVANNIGITPLHLAALAGHTDMVTLLMANKANVKARDVFGLTPLHCAAQYGHVDTIKVLLANGAEIEAKTNTQGLTPLHWAAFWGHIEGVKCLLSSGADINARDNTGNTPLTWAESYGQHDLARLLARKGGKGHVHEKLYGLDASWHVD
ncbi:MAG: ankyrin repeat domain-containing protein [Kiritimatiellae bacterium]|nr:ankyrin repeat domain-containing protein [Kiritimatiellia bacterium]